MEIQGIVQDIIYQNELNSYTIASFETDNELVTIVGYLPFIGNNDYSVNNIVICRNLFNIR